MPKPLIVGLTGAPGAGKTTVAGFLGAMGAAVVNADQVGHAVLENETVKSALVEAFGPDVAGPGGVINRERLGAAAFASSDKWRRLNVITHPFLIEALRQFIRTHKKEEIVVIDAALIVEWGEDVPVDVVVVIDAPKNRRREWLAALGRGDVSERERFQLPADEKLRRADIVVSNDGDVSKLKAKTALLYEELKTVAAGAKLRPNLTI